MDSIWWFTRQPVALSLPLHLTPVPAGFPSPAADHVQKRIDLNERLVHDPAATFFIRASGDSMRDAGILDGSILVVDAGRLPQDGDIVVARIDGRHTVKRLRQVNGRHELHPEHAGGGYPVLHPGHELQIFGVVTAHIVEHHRRRPSRTSGSS